MWRENLAGSASRINPQLKILENEKSITPYDQPFKFNLDQCLEKLVQKRGIPVLVAEGMLQMREINFQKSAGDWIDAEAMPLLYEIWELTENMAYSFKMSLANIHNRMVLLLNEAKEKGQTEFKQADLCQPLKVFLQRVTESGKELAKLKNLLYQRMDADFGVFAVYDFQRDFLDVPLQTTLNRYRIDDHKWFMAIRRWLKRQIGFIYKFKASVEKEEMLSISEKVVRYIQERTMKDENASYSSIFLTKGHIGDSFWVGRKDELHRFQNLFRQWEAGYRGAVILSGQRVSGKTFFGEYAANRFF